MELHGRVTRRENPSPYSVPVLWCARPPPPISTENEKSYYHVAAAKGLSLVRVICTDSAYRRSVFRAVARQSTGPLARAVWYCFAVRVTTTRANPLRSNNLLYAFLQNSPFPRTLIESLVKCNYCINTFVFKQCLEWPLEPSLLL